MLIKIGDIEEYKIEVEKSFIFMIYRPDIGLVLELN